MHPVLPFFICSLVARSGGSGRRPARGDGGQTTAEYALVLIGAAALAFLLISWATKSDAISNLFNIVVQHVTGNVK